MQTIIVKENSNETIEGNLIFKVLMNRKKLDSIRCEKYSQAIERIKTLNKIFKYSKFEIIFEIKK